MTRFPSLFLGLLAFGLAAGIGLPAQAGQVITFEGLASREVVSNQYLPVGLQVSGSGAGDHPYILQVGDGYNSAEFPPHSGKNVLYDDSGFIQINAAGETFTSAGAYITGNQVIWEKAYDVFGNLLGTASTPGPNFTSSGTSILPNYFLNISAPNIAHVTFFNHGNTFVLDDFRFTTPIVTVPEPSTLMIALGAVPVGLACWLLRRGHTRRFDRAGGEAKLSAAATSRAG